MPPMEYTLRSMSSWNSNRYIALVDTEGKPCADTEGNLWRCQWLEVLKLSAKVSPRFLGEERYCDKFSHQVIRKDRER
jgi:hypothetical protein